MATRLDDATGPRRARAGLDTVSLLAGEVHTFYSVPSGGVFVRGRWLEARFRAGRDQARSSASRNGFCWRSAQGRAGRSLLPVTQSRLWTFRLCTARTALSVLRLALQLLAPRIRRLARQTLATPPLRCYDVTTLAGARQAADRLGYCKQEPRPWAARGTRETRSSVGTLPCWLTFKDASASQKLTFRPTPRPPASQPQVREKPML